MTPEERAYAAADLKASPRGEPQRRLSPWRVLALLLVLGAVGAGVTARPWQSTTASPAAIQSSYMPYVDVTAAPEYAFEGPPTAAASNVVLGFVVADRAHACSPSWGDEYTLPQAASSLDLDRRIARLRQVGGQASVSFGGQANTELAAACTDQTRLTAAYAAVVRRYHLRTLDFDVEGTASSTPAATRRRAAALATLQRRARQAGRPLAVWLTLPVDPNGLTATGRSVLSATLQGGVDLAGVNGLTMDYGGSMPPGRTLTQAADSALTHLAGQVRTAYASSGVRLSTAEAWQRLGATPMIGQNDVAAERFDLADARALLGFARRHHLRRLSMWSLNRDQDCGPNYANASVVSDNCSGVAQQSSAFSQILGRFRPHRTARPQPVTRTAATTTNPTSLVDDPATSPYAIWNPDLPYPAETKVVWHRNVYEAKWWSQGDVPDAPVAAASDTPWTLIGPVLPGDHPLPTPTVPAGTYPVWNAHTVYRAGARVVYEGVGYLAKWYTQGDVPGLQVSDPGHTPWTLITWSRAAQPAAPRAGAVRRNG